MKIKNPHLKTDKVKKKKLSPKALKKRIKDLEARVTALENP